MRKKGLHLKSLQIYTSTEFAFPRYILSRWERENYTRGMDMETILFILMTGRIILLTRVGIRFIFFQEIFRKNNIA